MGSKFSEFSEGNMLNNTNRECVINIGNSYGIGMDNIAMGWMRISCGKLCHMKKF
jgi:hypothetical protein